MSDREQWLRAFAYACVKEAEAKLLVGGVPSAPLGGISDIEDFHRSVRERTAHLLDFLRSPDTDHRIFMKAREIVEQPPVSDQTLNQLIDELRALLDDRDQSLPSVS